MDFKDYGFVVDNSFNINEDFKKEYGIVTCNLSLTLDNKPLDFNTSNEEICKHIEEGKLVKTSQPAPGVFLDAYQKLINMGKKKIICFTLSSKLSGTYNSAKLAANMLDDNDIDKVYVFDTKQAGNHPSYFVYRIVEELQKNKDFDYLIKKYEKIAEECYTLLFVDDLGNIYKQGRLGKVEYKLGQILRIKPVLIFQHNFLDTASKTIGTKRAVRYCIDKITKDINDNPDKIFYCSSAEVQPNMVSDKIIEHLKQFENVRLYECSKPTPVITSHVGLGAVGVFVAMEDKE